MAREACVSRDDGVQLWVATTGDGPPIVLCHGGPGAWDDLADAAHMLDDRLTVHRWDQRGGGRSSRVGPFDVATFVADLEAIRVHFGHEQWIVGGHSWGATLALCYALAHPDRTRALVYLCGTGLAWQKWSATYHEEQRRRLSAEARERFAELKRRVRTPAEERELGVLNRATNYFARTRARERAERELDERFAFNLDANRELVAETKAWDEQEIAARCGRLAVPTLVVHGEGDPRPFGAVASLVDALPDVCVEIVPRAGHEPWLENPSALRSVLRTFLGLAK